MANIILIGGGSRSGKSDFALSLARRRGARRAFLAAAEALDAEMGERIALHQRSRGDDFTTIEEPLAVPEAIEKLQNFDVLVFDCLTLWLSNLLLADMAATAILARVDDLLVVLNHASFQTLVVTNEVGLGLVPDTALGRVFRDVAGLAHQKVSQAAGEVYLTILGTVLRLKPDLASMELGEAP